MSSGPNLPPLNFNMKVAGLSQVLAAFQQLQAQAKATSKSVTDSSAGMKLLTSVAGEFGKLLPALSVAAVAGGMIAMTKSALDAAVNIGKMSEKTGYSVETLSVFRVAAQRAGLDMDSLGAALVRFSRFTGSLDEGAAKARNTVRQLFGNVDALKGLSDDQRLIKVATRLGEMAPSATRSALAVDVLGRSGAQLLPTFDKLGKEGFAALAEEVKRAGLMFDTNFINSARQAKAEMILLEERVEALAIRFAAGLAPSIGAAMKALNAESGGEGGGVNFFESLGASAGFLIKLLLSGFLLVGKTIGFVMSEAEQAWTHFGDYAKDTYKSVINAILNNPQAISFGTLGVLAAIIKDAGKDTKPGENLFQDRLANFKKDMEKSMTDLWAKPAAAPPPGPTDAQRKQALEEMLKMQQARLKAAEAALTAELALYQVYFSNLSQAQKIAYDNSLTSMSDYYLARKQAAEAQNNQEIKELEARIALLKNPKYINPDEQPSARLARMTTIAGLQNQIDQKRLSISGKLVGLTEEERVAQEALARNILGFEDIVATAQGQRHATEMHALDEEIKAYEKALIQAGKTPAQAKVASGALRDVRTQQMAYEDLKRDATLSLADLDQQRADIQRKVATGQLTQYQGETQIIALEKLRLPVLREIAEAMLAQAEALHDDAKIADAKAMISKLDDLAAATDVAGKRMAELKAGMGDALGSGMEEFFTTGIQQASSLGEAFEGLAASVVGSLQKMLAKMIAVMIQQKIMAALFGGGGGEGGGGGGGLMGWLGGLFHGGGGGAAGGEEAWGEVASSALEFMAEGGLIRGPGSGTSDSIPIRASDHEFIVRSVVTRQPGVLGFLQSLNAMGAPGPRSRGRYGAFAAGGLVEGLASQAGATAGGRADLTVGLDEGLLLKKLEANRDFSRLVVRTLSKHPKATNAAIGKG